MFFMNNALLNEVKLQGVVYVIGSCDNIVRMRRVLVLVLLTQ